MAERERHVPCDRLAVMRAPAREHPGRQIQRLRGNLFHQRLALAGATAQHGVDEAGIAGGPAVGLHEANGEIDGGVIGHVHPEDLGGADQQRALRARRIGGDALVEQAGHHVAERAEPAQHGGDQAPHQRAIAVGKRLQSGMGAAAVELLVKCAVLLQHAVDDVGSNPPRGKTRHFGWRGKTLRWHAEARFSASGSSAAMGACLEDAISDTRICQM
ncbi:hypothetical protein ACVWYI_000478 [Bradyrhizobium sp. LB13.1]